MNERLICPYCNEWVDFDNSEMYNEDTLYEIECDNCDKKFGVRASMSWNYYEEKVDCWNGADHEWCNRVSAPRKYAVGKQACESCDATRTIPTDEWEAIEADTNHPQNWRSQRAKETPHA